MTWLTLRALLSRIPTIAYVIAFAALFLLAGGWATYRAGRTAGEVTVHRIALQDSVDKAVAQIDTAVQTTERVRVLAKKVKQWGDTSRERRNRIRETVEPMLAALPEPVVALIHQDDAQIRRDSAAIEAYVRVDSAWLHERFARIDADSVESHQLTIGQPTPRHHAIRNILIGIGLGIGSALIAGAVR